MKKHIAIFIGDAIEKIFRGEKTIESRFSQSRVLPYASVAKDDVILLKKSGGDIVGEVVADNVLYYDNLTPKSVEIIKKEYRAQIAADDSFWKERKNSKFASLIFLKNAKRYAIPLTFKKRDRRAWLIQKS